MGSWIGGRSIKDLADNNSDEVNLDVAAGDLKFNGTAVTATAAELNALDGLTSTVAELNILDGVTSTAAELNILDGVTSTAAELNILDGVTSTAAELNILDGVTSTAAELNILDGVTATAAQLNRVIGVPNNGLYPATNAYSLLKAANYDPSDATGATVLTDAAMYLCAIYLPAAATLTGVAWSQNVAGDTTQDNNNRIGLYTSDGTNLALVASCADDGTLWEGAQGIKQKAFSSTYAAAAGSYWIGALPNWSAASVVPQLACKDTNVDYAGLNAVLPITAGTIQNGVMTGQTDLPAAPLWSSVVSTVAAPWFGVY